MALSKENALVRDILSKMLVNLVDKCGDQLLVDVELPMFKIAFGDQNVLTNKNNNLFFNHPAFIGRNVLNLAVRKFISTEYYWVDQEKMEEMATLIYSSDKIYELIEKRFGLDKHCLGADPHKEAMLIIDGFIGILYELHDYSAVEQWITPLLKIFCPMLFIKLPKLLYNQLFGLVKEDDDQSSDYKPGKNFLNYVVRGKGEIRAKDVEVVFPAPFSGWTVDVMYKLSPTAEWYVHSRHGPSKRKARELAVIDIRSYYSRNPEAIHIHHLSCPNSNENNPKILPIPSEDYYDRETSLRSLIIVKPLSQKEEVLVCAGYQRKIIFLEANDDDETMMAALLGDFGMQDLAEEKIVNKPLKNPSSNIDKKPNASLDLVSPKASPCPTNPTKSKCTAKPSSSTKSITHDLSTSSLNIQSDILNIKAAIDQIPKLKSFLNDPSGQKRPKDYIERIKILLGAEITVRFEMSGPHHSLVFKATCVLCLNDLKVTTKAESTKKSDAEMQAYSSLIELLKE
ncbi:hypothetical protein CLU79DRAFT_780379 [Phycomyces nitens]|nr:hypothetical protein CLU79DRAFT_780379 [Phycomyces nitens]